MKRIAMAVLFLLVPAGCVVDIGGEDPDGELQSLSGCVAVGAELVTTADTSLRSRPRKNAAVVASVPVDSTVTALRACASSGYYNVSFEGAEGWIKGSLLSLAPQSEPDPDPQPDPEPDPPAGTVCTNPFFSTSDTNGGVSNGGYYIHNNMWNCGGYQCNETLYACAYDSWYVIANLDNDSGDGAVKTYPNVHKNFSNVPISSFNTISSTFAATSPHVGIYNVAFDVWLNGVATSNSNEIMIWTENYKQVPAGSKVATQTFSGHTFDIWKTSDSHYIALVPTTPITAGTLDLLAIFDHAISRGWIPSSSTIGQIGFGIELVSTDNADARFDITDFSLTTN